MTIQKMLEVKPELLGLYKEIQDTFNKEMEEINNNKDKLEYYNMIHPILKKWYSVIARINEL